MRVMLPCLGMLNADFQLVSISRDSFHVAGCSS
jgi:hypothetical protein